MKLKKIILLVLILFTFGCMNNNTPTDAVKQYLLSYKNLDSDVLDDLEEEIKKEELTETQKEKYRSILKKQYKDLSYKILKEEKEDDKTFVTVKVSVYDLYKAQSDASLYLADNMNEFYDNNGKYNSEKYLDYKLEQMKNMNDKVEYTIVFEVEKEDDEYRVIQPSETDLEKIHGIYSYDIK